MPDNSTSLAKHVMFFWKKKKPNNLNILIRNYNKGKMFTIMN